VTEWSFRLTITGIRLTDEEPDALFEAGCKDATFSLERRRHRARLLQTRPTWQQSAKLSPDFLAELNDRLDLRERLRHSPNASWRSKLEQSFH
jgi:hypothetical protein